MMNTNLEVLQERATKIVPIIKEVDSSFYNLIKDILENSTVQKMINYRQHYDTSTFEHCINVSYVSYLFCKKHNLDYHSMARAAMLHDLFLYDWRKEQRDIDIEGLHAFVHPKIALKNALQLFDLNDKEQDIILKHMWPLTLSFPRYKESFIITFVDKYCAIMESFEHYFKSEKQYIFKKQLT